MYAQSDTEQQTLMFICRLHEPGQYLKYVAALVYRAAAMVVRWRGVRRLGLAVTTPFVSGRDLNK